jgi:hypothetical protein
MDNDLCVNIVPLDVDNRHINRLSMVALRKEKQIGATRTDPMTNSDAFD